MSKSNKTPEGLVWTEYFEYDPSVASGLKWVSTKKSGSPVLSKNGTHYRVYVPGYGPFYCHRIIFEMFFGSLPDKLVVDHIDGNPENNTIENLRAVTQKVNSRNQTCRINNKSGVNGVQVRKNGEIVATWMKLDGKWGYKSYSISKYGFDEAFRLACNYRMQMINSLNHNGADYSDRHKGLK